MAGATPGVLANPAAMTRQFDIFDEIEIKDDLDTKPNADDAIDQFAETLEEIYRIASDLSFGDPEGVRRGQYGFDYFVSLNQNGGQRHYSPSGFNSGLKTSSGKYSVPLKKLHDAFVSREESWHDKLFVQFGVGPDEGSLKITITDADDSNSVTRASEYEKALERRSLDEARYVRSLIFRAAKVSVAKDQVTIVTRLPRADLDKLLANDAK